MPTRVKQATGAYLAVIPDQSSKTEKEELAQVEQGAEVV
jgi:hypothetical protein